MKIGDFLHPDDIIPDLSATTKVDALKELVAKLQDRQRVIDGDELLSVLMEREGLGSTGIGCGIAIPHAKLRHVGQPVLIFGRSKTGILFNAMDGKPVYLFFLLVADADSIDVYLTLLARVSRLIKNRDVRNRLLEATDADKLYGIIGEQDSRL
jgi:nitrogen PTS system EIIA component